MQTVRISKNSDSIVSHEGLNLYFCMNKEGLLPISDITILSWAAPDGVRMNSLEKEEEGVGLSFNKEKVLQSRMNTFMQSLVGSIDPSDSIEQLLLKEPKGELTKQAWRDELGIKMCLRILEQVAVCLFSVL